MSIQKISISPESSNYWDNEQNVAYLYRGYYIWHDDSRSSLFDAWNFAPAVYHVPDAALGETFAPYWDDNGDTESAETRRGCVAIIDRKFADGTATPATRRNAWGRRPEAPQPDPDAVKTVTLTVSLNEARTILAALSRRHDELCLAVSTPGCDELLAQVKDTYHSIDQQTFHPCS